MSPKPPIKHSLPWNLTPRQYEFLVHMCTCRTYSQAADKMGVTVHALVSAAKLAFAKMEVHSINQATAKIAVYEYTLKELEK